METVISPVITHASCDLGQQDRLAEAGREARVRAAVARRRGSRPRGRRARADFAFDFRACGQDVWHALRV
ncbi:MAG: hypothetical protein ACRDH8_10980 [Actinomycetota bacterium]